MIRHGSLGWNRISQASRLGSRGRHGRRLWGLEGLEERMLLSYTEYMVTDTGSYTSDPGSLPYAVMEANNNTNPAGSIIVFDGSVFNASSPGVIHLTSTLSLTNPNGESIAGAATLYGASSVQIDGNFSVRPFTVGSGVTASISGVTIQNGVDSSGQAGGILNLGNLSVLDTIIRGCSSQGVSLPNGLGAGGKGGGISDGGNLVVVDSTFSNDRAGELAGISPGEGGGIYMSPTAKLLSIGDSTFDSDQASLGGGIFTDSTDNGSGIVSGSLTVDGSAITNCTGGGIYNACPAEITGSTLSGNKATSTTYNGSNEGGGISNRGTATLDGDTIVNNSAKYGSGVYNQGSMTINGTTISSNSAAGASFGGGIYNVNYLTVTDSTIANNTIIGGMGGGIENTGFGGIPSRLIVIDSTIANNEAAQGGGINGNFMHLINCTIAYNTALSFPGGGGLYVTVSVADPQFPLLDNTIVALNMVFVHILPGGFYVGAPDDIAGSVDSGSANNLIGTAGSGGLSNSQGNQVDVADPGLGALSDNGGPTQTIALDWGSPASDAGSIALAVDPLNNNQPLVNDQRGAGFPRVVNGTIDVGALEYFNVPPILPIFRLNRGIAGLLALKTAADGITQLPAGRKLDLPLIGIDSFQLDFNEPVLLTAADVTVQSARGVNYGPVTVSGSGTTYNVTFAQPIAEADRVTITANIAGAKVFSGRLNVLPGDVNGDGVVNSKDLTAIRKDLKGKGSARSWMFGDLLDNGAVNSGDLAAARKYIGTKLPRLPAVKHPKASQALALVRRHPGMKPHDVPLRLQLREVLP